PRSAAQRPRRARKRGAPIDVRHDAPPANPDHGRSGGGKSGPSLRGQLDGGREVLAGSAQSRCGKRSAGMREGFGGSAEDSRTLEPALARKPASGRRERSTHCDRDRAASSVPRLAAVRTGRQKDLAPMRSAVLTAFIIATALFMENMDGTVISTSLPAIALDLHEDPIVLKLALTSYMLTLAVFIPASGWVADRFGARTVFCTAIVVFSLGSIACGASTSLGTLIAARVFQGLGGAMMVPVGRLVLLRSV